VRIDEAGSSTVYLQLSISAPGAAAPILSSRAAWTRTGRTVTVAWPTTARLVAGTYLVTVQARDHRGMHVARSARAPGRSTLVVAAPAPAPKPAPAPAPAPQPETPGVPTPAQTAADGAVFPVAGPHNFGGPEDRYGAPRGNHIHEGQDILTAEGTPDLAPLAGMITWTSYQAEGAGWYAVEHTQVGLDFMFAHCQAGSLDVAAGQPVTAGQMLCRAGQSGDATAPHLHFVMWVGGWQAQGGHSIDPLPYLQAWESDAASG
jgi:murein DD-endopeptidase MepM/ murein hydrolase activator NlpD